MKSGNRTRIRVDDGKPRVTGNQVISPIKFEIARMFRRRQTASEARAWVILRNRGVLGLKFRRQQIIDGFIADFYCAELRIVLEIDGPVHREDPIMAYDTERSAHFERQGIQVIRIGNDRVNQAEFESILRDQLPRRVSR